MVKAFFSRRVPFYLLSVEEASDELGFDAYPVEVDPIVLRNVRAVRAMVQGMEDTFMDNSAPEDCAQEEADLLSAAVRLIFKTRKQDNG